MAEIVKSFKNFIADIKEAAKVEAPKAPVKVKKEKPIEPPVEKDEPVKIDDKADWSKNGASWVIHFNSGGKTYSVMFTPNDATEEHWTFNYFLRGQKDSSDIKKFGDPVQWPDLWSHIYGIMKDFLRLSSPKTVKFIGMSDSKRRLQYRELFKVLVKHYWNYFRKLGYHSTFDYKNINRAPSFVIRKGSFKEEKPKNEK